MHKWFNRPDDDDPLLWPGLSCGCLLTLIVIVLWIITLIYPLLNK